MHRSKGPTLEKVLVDCNGVFNPGQIGVAIRRTTSLVGLQVLNYSRSAAGKKHTEEVYKFYTQLSEIPLEDLSCYQHPSCDIENPPKLEQDINKYEPVQSNPTQVNQDLLDFPFNMPVFFQLVQQNILITTSTGKIDLIEPITHL